MARFNSELPYDLIKQFADLETSSEKMMNEMVTAGAKVVENTQGRIRIIQGKMELEVRILEFSGQPLMAPDRGKMVRTIQESVSCRAFYRFRVDEKTIFAFETERASFEYEYP